MLTKPEYGPTLAQLSGNHWPRVRALLLAFSLLLVIAAGSWLLLRGNQSSIVVKGPVTFNVLVNERVQRLETRGKEMLRLIALPSELQQTMTVSPLSLPAYRAGSDPGSGLPVFAAREIRRMSAADPHFRLRSEGRARINSAGGYSIQYDTQRAGKLVYGVRFFLFPDDEPEVRTGIQIELLMLRENPRYTIANPDAVRRTGPLSLPLSSFYFGGEQG
jgi:hypothetical protein